MSNRNTAVKQGNTMSLNIGGAIKAAKDYYKHKKDLAYKRDKLDFDERKHRDLLADKKANRTQQLHIANQRHNDLMGKRQHDFDLLKAKTNAKLTTDNNRFGKQNHIVNMQSNTKKYEADRKVDAAKIKAQGEYNRGLGAEKFKFFHKDK